MRGACGRNYCPREHGHDRWSPAPSAPTTVATTGGAAAASPTALKTMGTVTLEVWGGVPPETGPGDLVAAFSKAYPNIKVNYTRFVNDDTGNTKLDTALQGGTPIDVYFSYTVPRMGQRIKAGVAEDLTPYIAGRQRGESVGGRHEGRLQEWR